MESWTPRPEEVGSVLLIVNGVNGRGVSTRLTDPALIQNILDVHQAVLAEREDLNNMIGSVADTAADLGRQVMDELKHDWHSDEKDKK